MGKETLNNLEGAGTFRAKLNNMFIELFGDQTVTGIKNYLTGLLKAPDVTTTGDFTVITGAQKTLVLSQPVYRDEFSSVLIPDTGAAAPDIVTHTVGGVGRSFYGFDGNATEERIGGTIEIPHDYKVGGDIEAHIHWRPSTTGTGTVQWFFDWEYTPPNAAPIPQTTLDVTATLTVDNQYWQLLHSFGNLPQPTTPFALGGTIGFNLRRTPSGDTYGADALLEQVAIHVPVDTMGSRQIYVK